ncbi:NAF1-domain-containing protein [Ramicandelaber brevisporus]|nr:NAF1-domain-containing protein [Ramicandelaber brevisporus]
MENDQQQQQQKMDTIEQAVAPVADEPAAAVAPQATSAPSGDKSSAAKQSLVVWESSESDSSSTDSDSTASSSDEDEDEDSKPAVQSAPSTAASTKPARPDYALDDDSDDDGDGEGDGHDSTFGFEKLRTKHEVDPDIPEVDLRHRVDEAVPLTSLGKIKSIVDTTLVIETSPEYAQNAALDIGSLIALEDRRVLGRVYDTFGPVAQPLYSIKYKSVDDLKVATEGLSTDSDAAMPAVYYVPPMATFVDATELRKFKGSDASNLYDEEVGEDEAEYSDDEMEAMMKKKKKSGGGGGGANKASKPGSKRDRHGNNRQLQSRDDAPPDELPIQSFGTLPETGMGRTGYFGQQPALLNRSIVITNSYLPPTGPFGTPISGPPGLSVTSDSQGGSYIQTDATTAAVAQPPFVSTTQLYMAPPQNASAVLSAVESSGTITSPVQPATMTVPPTRKLVDYDAMDDGF